MDVLALPPPALVETVAARADADRLLLVAFNAADSALAEPLHAALQRLPAVLRERNDAALEQRITDLLVLMLPTGIADVQRDIALDNAEARARFLADVPCLTSAQVAAAAGHKASNVSVTASRWKADRRIVAVQAHGRDLYPAFQFRDGKPHPTVAAALAALPTTWSAWATAFWFVSGNGWLGGVAPCDLLDQPERVVEAARRAAEPVVG
jgi:hypothetical protein